MDEATRLGKVATAQLKLKKFQNARNKQKQSPSLPPANPQTATPYFVPTDPNYSDYQERTANLADYFTGPTKEDPFLSLPTSVPSDSAFFIPSEPVPTQPTCSQVISSELPISKHNPESVNPLAVSNGNFADDSSLLPTQPIDEIHPSTLKNDTPTAVTEKMLQLSHQANGILQTSEQLTASFTSSGFADADLSVMCEQSPRNLNSHLSTTASSLGQSSPDLAPAEQYPFGMMNGRPGNCSMSSSSLNGAPQSGYIRELEERNVELASLLEKRSRALERTLAKLSMVQEQSSKAVAQAASTRAELEQTSSRDLAKAHEQIRAHAQTVGALVAEKTELLAKVTHLERLAADRQKEVELTNERLQVFRQQALESDRMVANLKSTVDRISSQNSDLNLQVERLKAEVKREADARGNLADNLQETTCTLNARNTEVLHLESSVQELRKQLELAQIYSSQLMTRPTDEPSDTGNDNTQLSIHPREAWIMERSSMAERIKELEETALRANKDRNRLEMQYKSVVSQLEQQLADSRAQCAAIGKSYQELESSLDQSRRSLRDRDDELAEYKSKLEAAFNESAARSNETVPITHAETCDHLDKIAELTSLTKQLQDDLESQTRELVTVKQQLNTATETIREKDALLVDRERVLETATSERTVLSRAVEQNRELKSQLTELQEAFVRLTNENMELTTQLHTHSHTHKAEDSHHHHADETDHHHHEQEPGVVVEVNTRLETLDCLDNRIRLAYRWLQDQESQSATLESLPTDSLELFSAFERTVQKTFSNLNKELAAQAKQNQLHVANSQQLPSLEEWQSLQVAHKQLEAKFVKCMDELGRISEDRSRLEGLVAHLEMEAATVGEYVTLFAHRRATAAHRAKAREELINRLIEDRRQLRHRLATMRESVLRQGNLSGTENIPPDGEAGTREVLQELRGLLDELTLATDDESATGSVSTDTNDEEIGSLTYDEVAAGTVIPLEQLRKQALQHDCPHCQCCTGNLMEI